jgi:3-hydroxyisobutyrate dehydrogenase-like beta-hydroxyacid dehydrogenase
MTQPTGDAVALIGVGRMGGPMARNLRRAGFAVTAYDTQPANVSALAEDGVAAAGTLGGRRARRGW